MKARLLIFFLFAFSFTYAQNRKADSLRNLIKTAKEDTNKVIWTVKLGLALMNEADHQTLIDIFTEAKDLAEKLQYKQGFANACNNMGILYLNQGLYNQSLRSHLAALKVREEAGDKKGIATSYQNLGIVELALKNHAKAFEYYSRAFALKEEQGDKMGMAGALQGIGLVVLKGGNPSKALEYYDRALALKRQLGDSGSVALLYTNIGMVYLEMDSLEKTEQYYTASTRLAERLKKTSVYPVLYTNMAKVLSRRGKYREALGYANRAMELVVNKGSSLDRLKNLELALSDIYAGLEDHRASLSHYKQFIRYQDSMYNEANTKKATQAEMNFEFEKKEARAKAEQEKKDAVAAAERRRQRIVLWSVAGFGLLVLIFAVFAWRSFLQKKRANQEISYQKHIIEEKQKEILDSIFYARRIQQTLLPNEKFLARKLAELRKGREAG